MDPENLLIFIAKFLDGNHTLKEIHKNLIEIGFKQDIDDLKNILSQIFIEEKLVFSPQSSDILSDRDMLKYDRILHFFASFDNIEITNVTRQMLYDETNLGYPKIEIAKKRLLKLNPEANIETISKKIENTDDLLNIIQQRNFDFVVNTMDNPRGKIRYIVDEVMYNTNIPYIFNGSTGSSVVIGPTIQKGKTKSYTELVPYNDINDIIANLNDEIYVTNVIEPMNDAVGQLTAYEVIKYITNCAELATWGERIKLDIDHLEINKYGY